MLGKSLVLIICTFMLSGVSLVQAQDAKPARGVSSVIAKSSPEFSVLKGNWVRPDGGYTITIKGVGPDGQLDAMYLNPNQLPFAKAQAQRGGDGLHVALELRAGGYSGSTYELSYDTASDTLKGVYYQAVAKQRFDVTFVRK